MSSMQLPDSAVNRIVGFLGEAGAVVSNHEETLIDSTAPDPPPAKPHEDVKTNSPSRNVNVIEDWQVTTIPCHKEEDLPNLGFVVRDHVLPVEDFSRLCCAARDWDGTFKQAGMGKQNSGWSNARVRGDRMAWVTQLMNRTTRDPSPSDVHLQKALEPLHETLNTLSDQLRTTFKLSGRRTTMLAHYPGGGTQYVSHRDVNLDMKSGMPVHENGECRVITVILYLNPGWEGGDKGGGQLVLEPYSDLPSDPRIQRSPVKIEPNGNRMVVFRSTLQHLVLPCHQHRWAITTWLYGKASPLYRSIQTLPDAPGFKPGTIFVAIPSYRDPELWETIASIFAAAQQPNRVFVGVCWQCDPSCDKFAVCDHPENVRFQIVSHAVAAGPCVARYMAQKLYSGEEYVLQIDSHMRFQQGWDAILIEMLHKCPSENPILTAYPTDYGNEDFDKVPVLYPTRFDGDKMLRQASRMVNKCESPIPTAMFAGGFNFAKAGHLNSVPYLPLQHLFFGEEAVMAARLWTSGYDFYCPPVQVVHHKWSREHRETFKPDQVRRKVSQELVRRFLAGADPTELQTELELGIDLGTGLDLSLQMTEKDVQVAAQLQMGTLRSLADYQKHAKVDFSSHQVFGIQQQLVEMVL